MELVGSDPLRAIETADRALLVARSRPDAAARTLAWRAIGLAARARGDLETAVTALRRAVRAATDAGDRASAAEARMTQAFVLLDLGRTSQALRQSARAATDLDGLAQARLRAQRALILQRCGRFTEALAEYDAVIPKFREADDHVWESRGRCNRGVLQAFRGNLAAGEMDLLRAQELLESVGRRIDAAAVLWNLGCMARERGDVVLALERFDAADAVCDEHGYIVGQRALDRASLLLSVGVIGEARTLAERAHQALSESHQAADLMECEVLLARITLLDGDPNSALEYARSAGTAARRQSRPGWVLFARLIELLSLERLGADGLTRRARSLAAAFERARWPEAATEARLAAARAASRACQHMAAKELLKDAQGMRGHRSAALLIGTWHTRALVLQATGEYREAARAVRSGMEVLSRHRASLGASDLQAHIPAIAEDLVKVGLQVAADSGNAAKVLLEVERWRAYDFRSRPLRPATDPELSEAVERLRRASSELLLANVGGSNAQHARSQQAARERDVVRLSRRAHADSWRKPLRTFSLQELRLGLGSRVLVEYLVVDHELMAITLTGVSHSTRCRPVLHRLGSVEAVENALTHLQFALARLATGRGSCGALQSALSGARHSADVLDAALLRPLLPRLNQLGARSIPVVLAPTEALHSVPWNLLRTLADVPVHIVRSGSAWLASQDNAQRRGVDLANAAEVFVTGPGVTRASLAGRGVGKVVSVAGASACVSRTLQLLEGAEVAHLAAHGSFRTDNPLLSCLHLTDGPLNVYDLQRLVVPPRLVVLAACHSGSAQALPGNQLLGVAHSLLSMGSAGVVATTLPTPDVETAVLMDALHGQLKAGLDLGAALLQARKALDRSTPAGFATSAGFDLYGC